MIATLEGFDGHDLRSDAHAFERIRKHDDQITSYRRSAADLRNWAHDVAFHWHQLDAEDQALLLSFHRRLTEIIERGRRPSMQQRFAAVRSIVRDLFTGQSVLFEFAAAWRDFDAAVRRVIISENGLAARVDAHVKTLSGEIAMAEADYEAGAFVPLELEVLQPSLK